MTCKARSHAGLKRTILLFAALIVPFTLQAAGPESSNEAQTERYFESIRSNPNAVLAFLREMPKGGDLHNHLVGAIYAESFIEWAAARRVCVWTPPAFT